MKRPAGLGFIFASFVGAYLLCAMPWSGWLLLARPDFVLLALMFWTLHEPRMIGQGAAFALGLLMDVGDSMLLGEHALEYVLAVYLAQVFRVRILTFRLPEQTLHLAGILTLSSFVLVLLNLVLGADFPGFAFLLSPLFTALLWAPATWLLYHPSVRRRRSESPS
ncbi:rod shape-determining protein MreD [Betaproteobacteria bacterium GR16-43]|nr:rod shape-determining protein MreD [Betaproteobacteria bacterium GR16-43]